ncbi:MAG TPA: hypothetical protein VMF35_12230 [Acidimicrobiales bacterium]|nr:hypothetical protein [Acidimicrobiales bacterium]
MSMYTELLDAAYGQRRACPVASPDDAIEEVRRRRDELELGPMGAGRVDMLGVAAADTVPLVLALELGYDVALLRLAAMLGIDSDPSSFELPTHERLRLEDAFRTRGISLEAPELDAR